MASLLTDAPHSVLSAGPLMLDTSSRLLTGPADAVVLERGSYLVLRELMRRPGAVVSLASLIEAAWPDPDAEPENPEHAVRNRVLRARAALERVGVPGDRLRLRFSEGYSLEGEPRVVRSYTRAQAAALDRMAAANPDLAAVLAPC